VSAVGCLGSLGASGAVAKGPIHTPRSTVENKCLLEERYCYVALNFSLKKLKTLIKSTKYVISGTE
jgi:hypothetical protein